MSMQNQNNTPTIAEQWLRFTLAVLPPDASDRQRSEMRKAFYGGAHSMLMAMVCAAALEESDAVKVLEEFQLESKRFAEMVESGEM